MFTHGLRLIANHCYLVTACMFLVIAILSLMPLTQVPLVPGNDKTHHVLAYMVLAFPIGLRQPRYWVVMYGVLIGLSGCIELIQPLVNRYAQWFDLLANVCGVGLGGLLASVIRVLVLRRK